MSDPRFETGVLRPADLRSHCLSQSVKLHTHAHTHAHRHTHRQYVYALGYNVESMSNF
jgi:hypothetical protein